ncbi:protein LEO1 homolog [Triticum dicoccoides]|uniref:protein LEO1 homolog n=1 Tax=Triticum dicoccoides TaxID=85692 RepID=UPI00189179B0|nr:protein LEO1 homolog [Triticum dicoccoides]
MDKIFGDLSNSDEEVEDRANGGREVSGLNANNHAGGDNGHWNHSCRSLRLAHATTKHKYKSNSRRLHGNRWEDRKPGSHGPAGLAKQSVDEGHHVVLGYQNMRGNKEVMNGEKEGCHQRTETTRTRIVASEFEGSKYNCNVDQDRKDGEVKRTRKIGPTKDVLCDVGGSDVNGLALYGDTEDVNRLPTEGEGHCANILQPMDVTRDKDMCYEQESKHCLISPLLNLVVPHIPPSGQPDRLKVMKVSNVVGINPKPFDPETYMEEDDFVAPPARKLESNARFVQWKDGSMQLLIGDVALDVSVEESSQHTHLFRKNGKGLLQSQGRLLQKMRIMPPESFSRSQRSLTAPVDSQNK